MPHNRDQKHVVVLNLITLVDISINGWSQWLVNPLLQVEIHAFTLNIILLILGVAKVNSIAIELIWSRRKMRPKTNTMN